jgi:hypothetical protein
VRSHAQHAIFIIRGTVPSDRISRRGSELLHDCALLHAVMPACRAFFSGAVCMMQVFLTNQPMSGVGEENSSHYLDASASYYFCFDFHAETLQ